MNGQQSAQGKAQMASHLLGMQCIVETQTANGADVLWGERRQQQPDVGNLIGDLMLPKNSADHDPGLLGLGDVRHALWQDGIPVVGPAVLGQEADKSLLRSAARSAARVSTESMAREAYGECGRHGG